MHSLGNRKSVIDDVLDFIYDNKYIIHHFTVVKFSKALNIVIGYFPAMNNFLQATSC